MAIRLMDDVIPQATVIGVDLFTQKAFPEWNRWLIYGMAIAGYGGAMLNMGGPFVKEMGKSSLPLAARQFSETFLGGTSSRVVNSRLAFRPAQLGGIGKPVERSYESEFNKSGTF